MFNIERLSSIYSRDLLQMFEDLAKEHALFMEKMKQIAPKEVELANYLDKQKQERIRKRILDNAGSQKREIIRQLDKFEVVFDGNK